MSRYIDAENLDCISYQGVPDGYEDTFDSGVLYAMNLVYEQPTVDAVPWEFLERYAEWFCAGVTFPEFIRETKQFYADTCKAMEGGGVDEQIHRH